MRPRTLNQTEPDAETKPGERQTPAVLAGLTPMLVDLRGLSALLSRSTASLERDDAAGRLPAALWIGGSKRWRYAEIAAWVEGGCPDRRSWEALKGR